MARSYTLLRPSVADTVVNKQASQKEQHDKKGRERQFEVNQHVLVENPKGDPKWLPGIFLGPLSYEVKVNDNIWKWHVDQMITSSTHTCTKCVPFARWKLFYIMALVRRRVYLYQAGA